LKKSEGKTVTKDLFRKKEEEHREGKEGGRGVGSKGKTLLQAKDIVA